MSDVYKIGCWTNIALQSYEILWIQIVLAHVMNDMIQKMQHLRVIPACFLMVLVWKSTNNGLLQRSIANLKAIVLAALVWSLILNSISSQWLTNWLTAQSSDWPVEWLIYWLPEHSIERLIEYLTGILNSTYQSQCQTVDTKQVTAPTTG